jgi:predicted kinase
VIEHLVVVGGMPGVGKTWLSRQLATTLSYGLLSRDEIKEAMYDALAKPPEVEELDWSRSVGAAAFSVFLRIAGRLGPRLILDAHFQQRFGGAEDVLALAPGATQLFLHAPLEVVRQRHEARLNERHAAHRSYPLPTLADLEAAAPHFAPLDLGGPLLEIDTSLPVDVADVAAWVRSHGPHPR